MDKATACSTRRYAATKAQQGGIGANRCSGWLRRRLLVAAVLIFAEVAAIAAPVCTDWVAGGSPFALFYGSTPDSAVTSFYGWLMTNDQSAVTYAVQSCPIVGASPSRTATCDILATCPGSPDCPTPRTWNTTTTSWEEALNSYCPVGWVPDPNIPCLCIPPVVLGLKAAGACDHCKGDPTDISNGNVFEQEVDYSGAGVNPLRFVRTYNSIAANVRPLSYTATFLGPQPTGVGWSATYFQRLVLSTNNNQPVVYALRPSGQMLTFYLVGSAYVADGDVKDVLTTAGSGYQYRAANNTVETYGSAGQLLSVSMRGQAPVTVTADATGSYPTAVTDAFGHALQFAYTQNASGHQLLHSVTDPAGGSITYAYDAQDNPTGVTYQDTASRHYAYTAYTVPLLTQLTDESSTALSNWLYTTDGTNVVGSHSAGNVNNYVFSSSNGVNTVTDPLGTVRTYSTQLVLGIYRYMGSTGLCPGCGEDMSRGLDAYANVTSRTDFNNNQTTYVYDLTRDLETSRTEALGTPRARTITTTWHPTYRLAATITEPNRSTGYTFDGSGNTLTKTVTDTATSTTRVWTYTYDSYGRMLTADGPRTDVVDKTTYAYYTCTTGIQCGQISTITNAAGQVTTYSTYNAYGQPLTITDPNGVVTTLTYDARQRLKTRQVGTETTMFDYYPIGLLQKVTLPDSSYVQYTYDPAQRLIQIADGLGSKITYTLDAMGNRIAESAYDPLNVLSRTRSRVYNALNQLSQDIGAAGTLAVTTAYGYDNNGNQTTINAPMSRNTTNQYDELNRLKQITDPASGNTYFGYDANDNLMSVTDPRTLNTSYTYTGFRDLKTQVSPDTGTTTNTYDSGGNLKTSTDARNAISTYTYDTLNRVKTVAYKIGSTTDQTITYTYDAGTNGKGRLTGASDANHSMTWAYDNLGRVISKGQTLGSVTKTVGYAYTNGDMTTETTPSGQTVVYSYTNGQVTQISVNGTTLLSNVVYEPFGPVRGWA